jgi:hypothetical protein
MYRSYWGYGGGYYPRGYLGAGIGYPYQPLLAFPYYGCGYGYPGCGYGYGYPYY